METVQISKKQLKNINSFLINLSYDISCGNVNKLFVKTKIEEFQRYLERCKNE